MNELSLFSGAGGGLLGSILLGWRTVGYVEFNEYCQRVIAQRITDGILPEAPIFGDIRAFIGEGYAEAYQGMVDILSAGFPCQPFSVAGQRRGEEDDRNMWPETIECIRLVRPRFCLLENVPGLISSGYFNRILGDLAESGYDARWKVISAAEVGAPHKRDRLWIVAYSDNTKAPRQREYCGKGLRIPESGKPSERSQDVANSKCTGLERGNLQSGFCGEAESGNQRETFVMGSEVANTEGRRWRGGTWLGHSERWENLQLESRSKQTGYNAWSTEPDVGRVADGIPSRVDRLKAVGDGQVPQVVRTAWEVLTNV